MLELGSWKEILESKEAKLIRESAETTYKQRRRDWSIKNIQKTDQFVVFKPSDSKTTD